MHLATAFSLWHSFESWLLIGTAAHFGEGKVFPSHDTIEEKWVASKIRTIDVV